MHALPWSHRHVALSSRAEPLLPEALAPEAGRRRDAHSESVLGAQASTEGRQGYAVNQGFSLGDGGSLLALLLFIEVSFAYLKPVSGIQCNHSAVPAPAPYSPGTCLSPPTGASHEQLPVLVLTAAFLLAREGGSAPGRGHGGLPLAPHPRQQTELPRAQGCPAHPLFPRVRPLLNRPGSPGLFQVLYERAAVLTRKDPMPAASSTVLRPLQGLLVFIFPSVRLHLSILSPRLGI